jgi:hypothetical protein
MYSKYSSGEPQTCVCDEAPTVGRFVIACVEPPANVSEEPPKHEPDVKRLQSNVPFLIVTFPTEFGADGPAASPDGDAPSVN